MKLIKNNKIIFEYFIYILSIILQILLIIISAKFLTEETFVKFNVYIAYINIIVIIINCTTLNYLMIYNNDQISPLLFENFLAFISLPLTVLLFDINREILVYLFALTILKLNLNLFCRYFLVNDKLIESLIYNFVGNSLWVVFALIYYFYIKSITIEIFFIIWIISLILTCLFYFFFNPIKFNFSINRIKIFISFYFKNYHFSFLFPSFLNFERIVFFKIFTSIGLLSTYTALSKIANLFYEVSVGFIVQKKIGRKFKINILYIIIGMILANLCVYICYKISYFNKIILDIFSGKITNEFDYIFPFILLNITFLGFLRLMYVDMVKKKLFNKLFFIVILIYSSFIIIIFSKPNIITAISIEAFMIVLSCIFSSIFLKNEIKVSNKS